MDIYSFIFITRFTGVIQRWNQHRLKMTHGTGPVHREVGSMSANSTPSRVFKNASTFLLLSLIVTSFALHYTKLFSQKQCLLPACDISSMNNSYCSHGVRPATNYNPSIPLSSSIFLLFLYVYWVFLLTFSLKCFIILFILV